MGSPPVLPFRANRDRLFFIPAGRKSPEDQPFGAGFTGMRPNLRCIADCSYVGNRNVNPTRGPQPRGPFFGAAAQ